MQSGDFPGSCPMPITPRRLRSIAPWLAFPLLALAVYWSGLYGGFIFDDYSNLVTNQSWKVESLHGWLRPLSSGIASDMGRPLAMLSFAVNYYFSGMDPFWLKLTSVCWHVVNALLVWKLCERLFALAPAADEHARMGRFAAFAVALAWLLHPLQVSTVLYVVQRMEVAACTCVLLALLAWLKARTPSPPLAGERIGARGSFWLALCALSIVVGLGFKETALLAPAFIFVVEATLLHFRDRDGRTSRLLLAAFAFGIAAALAVYVLKIVPNALQPWAYSGRNFDLHQRLLTQLPVLAMYLRQIVLPLPRSLWFYYDNYPVSHGLLSPPGTLFALIALLALVAVAWRVRRAYPLATLGIAWFFVGHALTSNVIPLELVFEHRNYFPLLGILIALAQGIAWLTRTLRLKARRIIAIALALALAVPCAMQAYAWGNTLRLAKALAERNPGSPRATYDLGRTYLILSNYDKASPYFTLAHAALQRASEVPNAPPLADSALIMMDARSDTPVPDATWDALRAKLVLHSIGAQERLAMGSLSQCRYQHLCDYDDAQMQRSFVVALQHDPWSADMHALYAFYAVNALGDVPLAVHEGREAVRHDPNEMQYQVNLAKFLAVEGKSPQELDALLAKIRGGDHTDHFADDLAEIDRTRARTGH